MCLVAIDVSDLQEDRGLVGAHDHGEPVSKVPDPDRVSVGVQDLALVESVLERGRGEAPDTWLPERPFSLYDLFVVSDEQIQKWADEAEAGYDVEELKRRGRGRPGRGAEPMQVIAVRLTADEIAAVDAIAAREHLSRSEAIRRALADYAA